MGFRIHMIGRQRVVILQKFDNSVLVRYVKSGIESCVNPNLIKSKDVNDFKKNQNQKPQRKNPNNNNQLNFEL